MRTTILSVAAIAAVLGLSFTASAAPQAQAVEQTGRAVQAPAAATAPRHSHMGEKIGVRAEQVVAAGSAAKRTTPAKSAATRHNHQRDFK